MASLVVLNHSYSSYGVVVRVSLAEPVSEETVRAEVPALKNAVPGLSFFRLDCTLQNTLDQAKSVSLHLTTSGVGGGVQGTLDTPPVVINGVDALGTSGGPTINDISAHQTVHRVNYFDVTGALSGRLAAYLVLTAPSSDTGADYQQTPALFLVASGAPAATDTP